jgi:rhodanese-related sulfurtransferase
MKKLIFIVLVFATILIGCTAEKVKGNNMNKTAYTLIEQDKAKEMMNDENIVVLDVRTKEEYDEGHIPNAVLLPVTEIEENAEKILTDKKATILVYCRSGNRSETASKKLIELGYTNVYDFGGINTWEYEVVK